ncbi:cytochrome-c peroxidase [Psychroflexus montanilacus]|uniref:cytochrome-c peroxidase n=1 Tax=Psychroflexus montanilacus TaxID=2873598 RepID=UPI001CCCF0FB|nr:cytochrome c peroxidase [Psychroflexus montanilacus]MBZ9651584.1 c-type cytochrome [Psychroflexus montanilacus]
MKLSLLIFCLYFCLACNSDEDTYVPISEDKALDFPQPDFFPQPVYDLDENPPTEKGFELGKKLFYDGRLSSTGVISCGFCHIQEFSFTHHTHEVSHGVNGALGTRNAQPLVNLAYFNEFSWDGAAPHLDAFSIIPITTDVEMNETVTNVLNKLESDEEYIDLFSIAFENGKVNTQNMFRALSQFMVMMVSADTKYDKVLEGNAVFTEAEAAGKALFDSKCSGCHEGILFTDQSYRNNGLPIDPRYNDIGRKRVTGLETDKYKFKVPSLRNIAVSLPYMHDGRFKTLKEVLDFYDSGVQLTENLDSVFQQSNSIGISLSETEKEQLIAFLNTLTDDNFLLDRRFSEF